MENLDILFALSITLLIEPIAVYFVFKMEGKAFILSFLYNLLLNPAMNLVLPLLNQDRYYLYLTLFEIATFLLEALLLFLILRKGIVKAILASLLSNLFSLGVGLSFNAMNLPYKVRLILFIAFTTLDIIALGIFLALAFLNVANKEDRGDDRPGKSQR
ncbi:MAG: hypothetical protein K6B65_01360 [Bacilli bacterium]|nr:hypothetical protein [Bacilli bacterium]